MRMTQTLRARLARFTRDTRGTVATEAVIALPVIFWAFLAAFVFFDAYRQSSINLKAAYMVGDTLSRETNSIDDDYMDGMKGLFDHLAGRATNTRMRVTVLQWDDEDEAYLRDWSEARGAVSPLAQNDLSGIADKLPVMADNERVILVETWSHYTPPFKIGLPAQDMYNFVFTSPRFAPLLRYSS